MVSTAPYRCCRSTDTVRLRPARWIEPGLGAPVGLARSPGVTLPARPKRAPAVERFDFPGTAPPTSCWRKRSTFFISLAMMSKRLAPHAAAAACDRPATGSRRYIAAREM